jgi:hypothetical protein
MGNVPSDLLLLVVVSMFGGCAGVTTHWGVIPVWAA